MSTNEPFIQFLSFRGKDYKTTGVLLIVEEPSLVNMLIKLWLTCLKNTSHVKSYHRMLSRDYFKFYWNFDDIKMLLLGPHWWWLSKDFCKSVMPSQIRQVISKISLIYIFHFFHHVTENFSGILRLKASPRNQI